MASDPKWTPLWGAGGRGRIGRVITGIIPMYVQWNIIIVYEGNSFNNKAEYLFISYNMRLLRHVHFIKMIGGLTQHKRKPARSANIKSLQISYLAKIVSILLYIKC